MTSTRLKLIGFALANTFLLSACGGGGGGASTPEPTSTPNPTPTSSVWTQGVFEAEDTYKNYCETPRTGIDPFSNRAYPDRQGSSMQEKMWLRSWSNDTYLWYDEIIDRNPTSYSVSNYFALLKTNQRIDSGAEKDKFHYTRDTDEYNTVSQGGVSSDYGIEWNFVSVTSPRKLIVLYTEVDSPAANNGVYRGLELTQIDGIDFINTNVSSEIDSINEALFPSDRNQTHTFTFIDPNNNNAEVEFTLTSANITLDFVPEANIITTTQGDVGYLRFNGFNQTGQEQLIQAFTDFETANIDELVVDLRYNGGGLLAMSSQLAYMVAGDFQTTNKTFEETQFNDKYPTRNPVTQETLSPTEFYDKEIDWINGVFTTTQLPSVNLSRIYVITTDNTCSASEAFINGLRGIDVEVIQIGGSTCGKPYGFYPTDNCGTTYFTIQFQGVNHKGFGEYSDGFSPKANPQFAAELKGCSVKDDLTHQLGDSNEAMLSSTLYYIENNSCKPQTQRLLNKAVQPEPNPNSIAIKTPNDQLENSKIYTHIKAIGE